MVYSKLWNKTELRWIWTYQAVSAIGALYPAVIYLFYRDPAPSILAYLRWLGALPGALRLFYFVLLSVEALSLIFAEPPPWYMAATQSVRFMIAPIGLYGSILHFWRSVNPDQEEALAWIFSCTIQDLTVFILWWLASYNGLVHVLIVWMAHRARLDRPTTLSQFDFQGTLELGPVRLAQRACTGVNTAQQSALWRFLNYALWVFRTPFGGLGAFLCLCSRKYLRGEPRAKVLTSLGFVDNRDDLDKDPEAADYPRVKPRGAIPAPQDEWNNRGRTAEPLHNGSSHSLLPLTVHDAEWTQRTAPATSAHPRTTQRGSDSAPERRFRPRYVCILDEAEDCGYRVVNTTESIDLDSVQYVFISYTRMHFDTSIQGDPSISAAKAGKVQNLTRTDVRTLISIAIDAATDAGVGAFWIDFECLRPDKPEDEGASRNISDVYQICDIVRGSYCMAIAVAPPVNTPCDDREGEHTSPPRRMWLQQYGSRLWTLPEALLCPSNHGIMLYFAAQGGFQSEQIEKRNLAERIWSDAETTRNLLEHYEGSLALSQIEFISLALQCLQRRKTVTRMPADFIYALMGLLRERIAVHETQSTFEAFANLSLANDSQKLLERLFCMRRADKGTAWYDMSDLWDANIRDVVPSCEVTAVAASDTVQIARMYGAVINWPPLPGVEFELTRPRNFGLLWRLQRGGLPIIPMQFLMMWLLALVWLVCVTLADHSDDPSLRPMNALMNALMLIFLAQPAVPMLSCCLFLPRSLNRLYSGEIKFVQARFFGFHGIADLGVAEGTVFGRNCGRLTWSGLNPGRSASHSGEQDADSTFTLVDTWLMTANTFEASTRPSIVAVPGKHRGMLRGMLCSYDEVEGVYHREEVLRMDERVLQHLSVMEPARFSLLPKPVFRDDDILAVLNDDDELAA